VVSEWHLRLVGYNVCGFNVVFIFRGFIVAHCFILKIPDTDRKNSKLKKQRKVTVCSFIKPLLMTARKMKTRQRRTFSRLPSDSVRCRWMSGLNTCWLLRYEWACTVEARTDKLRKELSFNRKSEEIFRNSL
jgi:hypothetical protein